MIDKSIDSTFSRNVLDICNKIVAYKDKYIEYDNRLIGPVSRADGKLLPTELYGSKEVQDLINNKLNTLIRNRIGMSVKFINTYSNDADDEVLLGIYCQTGISSIIFPKSNKFKESITSMFNDISDIGLLLAGDINEIHSGMGIREIILNQTQFVLDFDKLVRDKGITIDDANHKITNLPKDIVFPIVLGLGNIEYRNLTGIQLAGIIMHEIGHAYTAIKYTLNNTINNVGMFRELNTKANDLMITKSDLGKELLVLEEADYLNNTKNSEYVADMFSADFGFGTAMIDFLIGPGRTSTLYKFANPIFGITVLPPLQNREEEVKEISLYDTKYRRAKRVLNNLIKRLRTTPNKGKGILQKNIDNIQNLMSGMEEVESSNMNKRTTDLIEDLVDNTLFVSANRLK